MKKFLWIIFILCSTFLLFRFTNMYNLNKITTNEQVVASKQLNKFETIKIYENKKNGFLSYIIYNNFTMKIKTHGFQGSVKSFYDDKGFSFWEIPLSENNKIVCGKYNKDIINSIKINSKIEPSYDKDKQFWLVHLRKQTLKKISVYDSNKKRFDMNF